MVPKCPSPRASRGKGTPKLGEGEMTNPKKYLRFTSDLATQMDLKSVHAHAWGAATLANLYHQLGVASRADTHQIAGCLTLLEMRSYQEASASSSTYARSCIHNHKSCCCKLCFLFNGVHHHVCFMLLFITFEGDPRSDDCCDYDNDCHSSSALLEHLLFATRLLDDRSSILKAYLNVCFILPSRLMLLPWRIQSPINQP
ncbi:hypothetical protein Dimus_007467 [Dionaea muscipula]